MTSTRTKAPAPSPRRAAGKRPARKGDAAKERATVALYRAAEAYIRLAGGSAVVIGGVEIQRWPGDLQFNYRLSIRITGVPPKAKARA